MTTFAILATLALGPAISQEGAKPETKTTLLDDVRVVVRPGKVMERADVLIRDGRIAEVSPNVAAPEGAETIDGRGLTVYPGLIHPLLRVSVDGVIPSTTGLTPAQLAARRDGDPMNVASNVLCKVRSAELEQKSVASFESLSRNGYAVAQIGAAGGILGPQTAVVTLGDSNLTKQDVVAATENVPISLASRGFGGGGGGGGYPGSTMGVIATIRQALYDAARYARLSKAGNLEKAGLKPDAGLEALGRVLSGSKWAVFDDLNESSFFQSLRIANEFSIKPVLGFRAGAGAVADLLKQSAAGVLLKGDIPSKPTIGDKLDNVSLAGVRSYFNEAQAAAELEKSGIEFCYAPTSTTDPLAGIRTYVRAGLSKEAALASMTTRPAELLGVASQCGTVEPGKLGNLVVVQGDLFDSSSQVMAVFVGGSRVDFKMPERRKPEDLKPDAPLAMLPPNYDPFPRPAETKPAFRLYRNATIWTQGPQGTLRGADILIKDGKIVAVGKGLAAPAGCETIDAKGLHISPGIWDCHSHTGIDGGVNEGSNMVTVECRIADVINARQIGIYRQLSGGTVGAQQLHGSANAIGGQTSPVKWRWGEPPTAFPIEGAPPGVKFALGQNPIREDPERTFGQQQAPPDGTTLLTWRPRTRMGVEEAIRRALQLGIEYNQAWEDFRAGRSTIEPRRDLQLEGLGEIASGKRLIHSHGYRADELLMLIRVAKEFGAKIATLQHVLEGYKLADEMAAEGIGGSTFADWWGYKLEAYDAIPYNAALMAERGVSVSVNSDSDNHARRLNQEAAKSMRYGDVSPEVALSFVTIEPARQMGIAGRTGSLEPGKDADLAVWTAEPTSVFAVCLETYVDGVKRFDRANDAKQREDRVAELKRAKQVLSEGPGTGENPFITGASGVGLDGNGGLQPSTAKFGLGPVTGKPGTMRYPRSAVWITGATVHPMEGDPFVGDVLIGEDGKIKAVGARLDGRGALRVDARGKHLYPGLIDPATGIGLNEIGQVPASDDSSEKGNFHPDYRVERVINPEWETMAVARQQGVLTVLVKPSGSGLPGQVALINTEGYTWEDLTVQGGLGIATTLGGGGFNFGEEEEDCCDDQTAGQGRRGQGGGGQSASQALEALSTQLAQAREYVKTRSEATPEKPVPRDQRQEAMAQVAEGKMPLVISVNAAEDIKAAVAWAEKENVPILLYGCSGAGEIAEWLAAKQVPICLAAVYSMPSADQPVDYYYSLPARLMKAGVRFCLTTNNDKDVRQLRDQAGWAAAYGVDREDAARLITLLPARILGVADRLGAIKTGLDGTVILTDGDIIETKTHVLRAWINGREVDLTNKQTRLYEKYRNRPKPQKSP